MNDKGSTSEFSELSERLIEEHWNFYPTTGSRIGRHEYDGKLPDLTPGHISQRKREIRRGLEELQAIDSSSFEADELLSYRMLDLFLERELFTFEECGRWRTTRCGRPDF